MKTAALLALLLLSSAASARAELIKEVRIVMGTRLEITLCGGSEMRVALDETFDIVQDLDRLLSNYKPDSEISALNGAPPNTERSVSSDVFRILMEAKRLNVETGKAFDVTVGPIVKLWIDAAAGGRVPAADEISRARAAVGSDRLKLNYSRQSVTFARPGMRIDTDGIGKGFAVDKAAAFLKSKNIACALIDFGHSSVLAIGAPPGEKSWRLLIQFPGEAPLGRVYLKDAALSASDSHSRALIVDGRKTARLIDPRLGRPVSVQRQSVVIGPDATTAEALSKAVIMRSPDSLQKVRGLAPFEYLLRNLAGEIARSENFPWEEHGSPPS